MYRGVFVVELLLKLLDLAYLFQAQCKFKTFPDIKYSIKQQFTQVQNIFNIIIIHLKNKIFYSVFVYRKYYLMIASWYISP